MLPVISWLIHCCWLAHGSSVCTLATKQANDRFFCVCLFLRRRFQLVTFSIHLLVSFSIGSFATSCCELKYRISWLLRVDSFRYSFNEIRNYCQTNSQELIIQPFWHFFIRMKTYKLEFSTNFVFVSLAFVPLGFIQNDILLRNLSSKYFNELLIFWNGFFFTKTCCETFQ